MLGVQVMGPNMSGEVVAAISPVSSGSGAPVSPRHVAVAGSPLAGSQRSPASSTGSERDAWVVLLAVQGLGPVAFDALLAAFGSATAVLEAASEDSGPARLREAAAIGPDLARRICEGIDDGFRVVDRVRSLGLSVVTLEEPEYPSRLRRVEMPPPLLFVRGSLDCLQAAKSVAVVGTRWPTDKGRLIAGWIGAAVARTGALVVSGLAVGIDGAAHAAVVGEGGATAAVLGGGHACMFPRAHERLADAIVATGGAVIAELTPDTPPTRGTFPRRNRLVSGLSDATVVVEAGRRSGALITAGWALEQGRECFVVPGAFDAPTSIGCHEFLRAFPGQARVVCGIPELIEDLELFDASLGNNSSGGEGAAPKETGRASLLATLSPVERVVAEILTEGAATADDLARRTTLAVATILSALTLLELRGLISSAGGRYVPSGSLARWSEPPRAGRAQPRAKL